MKRETPITALFFLFASLALSGCQSVDFFIREHYYSEVYTSLDPGTQGRLRGGIVREGDTKEMVVLALGKPDSSSASNGQEEWTYKKFTGGDVTNGTSMHSTIVGTGSLSVSKQVLFRPDQLNQLRVAEVR
jgi:hypothetical protein